MENRWFENIIDAQSSDKIAESNQKDNNNSVRIVEKTKENKSKGVRKRPIRVLKAVSSLLTILTCHVKGGHPSPHVKIKISNRTLTMKDFSLKSWSTVLSGEKGLRVMEYKTMLTSERFMFHWQDDGKKMRCIAKVPGLPALQDIVLLRLHCELRAELLFVCSCCLL